MLFGKEIKEMNKTYVRLDNRHNVVMTVRGNFKQLKAFAKEILVPDCLYDCGEKVSPIITETDKTFCYEHKGHVTRTGRVDWIKSNHIKYSCNDKDKLGEYKVNLRVMTNNGDFDFTPYKEAIQLTGVSANFKCYDIFDICYPEHYAEESRIVTEIDMG